MSFLLDSPAEHREPSIVNLLRHHGLGFNAPCVNVKRMSKAR